MKRTLIVLSVLVLCWSVAAPASAADTGWRVRAFAAGMDPNLDETVPAVNPEYVDITSESALGFGASVEYQFTNLLGVELGYMQASPTIEISADVIGYGHLSLTDSMSTSAITLDLNLHLTPGSESFDFYVGGGVASMGYGDLHYVDPEGDPLDLSTSNNIAYSAKAGIGISLGKNSKWAAIGGLRYIWNDLEVSQADIDVADGSATFDFNIFSFTVGIAYSF